MAPVILVDQDGVLADFEAGFHAAFVAAHGPDAAIAPSERTTFYASDQLGEHWRDACRRIVRTEGFFSSLAPVEGAFDALDGMLAAGFEVFICTAPIVDSRHCIAEKAQWVREHLGQDWIGRLVIAHDKTVVRGDLLIDDRVDISGALTPVWRHVLFGAPYNRAAAHDLRLDRWSSWRDVVPDLLAA